MRPQIPNPGDPIRASWFSELMDWIEMDIMPRGDGRTTVVNGNIVSTLSGGGTTVTGLQPRWWIPVIASRTVGGQTQDYVTITNPATVTAFGNNYLPQEAEVTIPDLAVGDSVQIVAAFGYTNVPNPVIFVTYTDYRNSPLFALRDFHPYATLFYLRRVVDGYTIVLSDYCYTGWVNFDAAILDYDVSIIGFEPYLDGETPSIRSTNFFVAQPGGAPQNILIIPESEWGETTTHIYIYIYPETDDRDNYYCGLSNGEPQLPDGTPYAKYIVTKTPGQPQYWKFYMDYLVY